MEFPWVVTPRCNPNTKLKLLCIPYAGGGTSVYLPWLDKLNFEVELNIIQLPGRGSHFSQCPIDNMTELIDKLYPEVEHLLNQTYVIFGHSLGSRIGYELVKKAMNNGLSAPVHFFSSGSPSPKSKSIDEQSYVLSDKDFINKLRVMNGTPNEILENQELMAFLLPTLRADFKIADQYVCSQNIELPCTGTIISGDDDTIKEEDIEQWHEFFADSYRYKLTGDHFFINSNQSQVIELVNYKLEMLLTYKTKMTMHQ